jgi:UDP-N-acetylglucosamine 4-epimerase
VDYVLHQAALGSVPASIADPITANESNVSGFLNMLVAARDAKVRRFVYASSSAVYGDDETLPKLEEGIGKALSPYAVTKHVDELYADVFARCYGVPSVGLRYFNVFGSRQDPDGPYAAVIPRWLQAMRERKPVLIYGDGETSRDFCYIANVVQANLLAAATSISTRHVVLNVACQEHTTLNQLFNVLRDALRERYPHLERVKPTYKPFRSGDVRRSLASIAKAQKVIGYEPTHSFAEGIRDTVAQLTG